MIIFRPAAERQAACSSEVRLACPANHLPTDSASAVFDSAASAGSFRVAAARQSEEDTLKQETDITKKHNYHKNQTRQVDMVMEQEAGDSFQKPV